MQQNFKLHFPRKKVHPMVQKIVATKTFLPTTLKRAKERERNVHLGGLGGHLSVVYSQTT
jgi:hypothetical protein